MEKVVAMVKANTERPAVHDPRNRRGNRLRGDCSCRHAAENAIMTDPLLIPYDTRRKVALFYDRYLAKGRQGS